ncbi:hypothetical protein STEG23_020560, partial [Scotinomys teguina]
FLSEKDKIRPFVECYFEATYKKKVLEFIVSKGVVHDGRAKAIEAAAESSLLTSTPRMIREWRGGGGGEKEEEKRKKEEEEGGGGEEEEEEEEEIIFGEE